MTFRCQILSVVLAISSTSLSIAETSEASRLEIDGIDFCRNLEEETKTGQPLLIQIDDWPTTEFARELTGLIEACFGTKNVKLSGGYTDATQTQKLLVIHAEIDEVDQAVLQFLEEELAASNARIEELEAAGEAADRESAAARAASAEAQRRTAEARAATIAAQKAAAAALSRALQNL